VDLRGSKQRRPCGLRSRKIYFVNSVIVTGGVPASLLMSDARRLGVALICSTQSAGRRNYGHYSPGVVAQFVYAARLPRKSANAFFPSREASAILSKNMAEHFTGTDLPARKISHRQGFARAPRLFTTYEKSAGSRSEIIFIRRPFAKKFPVKAEGRAWASRSWARPLLPRGSFAKTSCSNRPHLNMLLNMLALVI